MGNLSVFGGTLSSNELQIKRQLEIPEIPGFPVKINLCFMFANIKVRLPKRQLR